MSATYYSGQGKLLVATRSAGGVPQGFVEVGNVPKLTIDITVDKFEHKESTTGNRLVDLTIIKQKTGKYSFTLDDLNMDNLALITYGSYATVAGGSAVNEVITAYTSKKTPTLYPNISAVTVTHSSGSPTYTVSTDYTIDSTNGGITAVSGGAITNAQSIKVSYTYGAHKKLDAFTTGSAPERWLRFEGLNTADGTKVIVNLFKARFDPLSGYDLINDELAAVTINGDLLADDTKTSGSQFFNQINFAA